MKNKDEILFSKTYWILTAYLSFIAGTAYGYFLPFSWAMILVLMTVTLAAKIVWNKNKIGLLFLVITACSSLGLLRMSFSLHTIDKSSIDFYNGQLIVFEGIIDQIPDQRPDKTYLAVKADLLTVPEKTPMQGKVRVTVPLLPEYRYGQRLEINGQLRTPKETPYFSYPEYLAKDDIFSVMENPAIVILKENEGNPVYAFLFQLRKSIEQQINSVFPEPSASFMAGLLLGVSKTIPPELSDGLKATGLTHIIAISGFNITIIISFLAGLVLQRFRRGTRFTIAATTVILFTILVGASASVVRASIMGIAGLLAVTLGRRSEALNMLLLALTIMTLFHPISLILDIGLQLSFLATLGLILLSPLFEKLLSKMPDWGFVKETLIATLAAQVMVLPIIVFHFERLSIISPLANIAVLFTIPLIMLFGSLTVVISFVPWLFWLSKLTGFIAWILMGYIMEVVRLCAGVPFAALEISWWNTALSIFFYASLGVIIYFFQKHVKKPHAESQDP